MTKKQNKILTLTNQYRNDLGPQVILSKDELETKLEKVFDEFSPYDFLRADNDIDELIDTSSYKMCITVDVRPGGDVWTRQKQQNCHSIDECYYIDLFVWCCSESEYFESWLPDGDELLSGKEKMSCKVNYLRENLKDWDTNSIGVYYQELEKYVH